MELYQIDFEPAGRRGKCPADQSFLDCARRLGVDLVSLCGGKGSCSRCKVQVLAGCVSEPTPSERKALSSEELGGGYRLACQTYPLSDCKLRVPPESLTTPQRTQVEGLEVTVHPEPPVSAYHLELPPPSLSDLKADAERLREALEQQHQVCCRTIDIEVLRDLSPRLRSWNWEAQASVRGNEVVALGPWPSRQLGLAVDLGTTKIASYLVDLESGQCLAAQGIMNPQIAYGENVVARIARIKESPTEAARLQKLAIGALNQLTVDLCAEVGAEPGEIVEAVVVGNTAMHHLFLCLPVEQLALSPYVPAVREALDIKARDVGLHIAPGAYVHLLPNIAGFVGADHVAMLLTTEPWQAGRVVLALDIGTNTEVCLVSDGEMTSVSCASGPAFEGAHIKHGMRAAKGAIEHLRLVDDRVEYQTIGMAPPVGLCGSGILDAMAQLYLAGVLDERGRMGIDHPRVRTYKGEREFVLVSEEERDGDPAITITQHDVRELQLAKGAIRTGIQVLLESKGHSEEDIEKVIIAGAFGTYIDVSSAVTIGMLPPLPLDRFRQVGNAAGMGAKLALISRSKRAEAQDIARRAGYIELAAAPRFAQIFAQAMHIGQHMMRVG
ncbi:MAG: ASKHA domain-containing protein [Chloroflexota bacterium]|nr:ASKHA domain-containing protein [Chloroflexota bacterium]